MFHFAVDTPIGKFGVFTFQYQFSLNSFSLFADLYIVRSGLSLVFLFLLSYIFYMS